MKVREHGTAAKYTREKCRCPACVSARSEYQRAWRSKNPERELQYNAAKRAKRNKAEEASRRRELLYQLSDEAYMSLLSKQDNRCAICLTSFDERQPHVDHDHGCCSGKKSCGKCIRGLLCHYCNTAIGKLHDDPVLLERAVSYLRTDNLQTQGA